MRCYHICIIKINPILLCSHQNFRPNSNILSRRRRSEVATPPWTLLLVMQKYEKRKASLCFFLTAEKAKLFSTNRICTGLPCKLPAILPWSKNACLQEHFCEAVNIAGKRSLQWQSRSLLCKLPAILYYTTKSSKSQTFVRAAWKNIESKGKFLIFYCNNNKSMI